MIGDLFVVDGQFSLDFLPKLGLPPQLDLLTDAETINIEHVGAVPRFPVLTGEGVTLLEIQDTKTRNLNDRFPALVKLDGILRIQDTKLSDANGLTNLVGADVVGEVELTGNTKLAICTLTDRLVDTGYVGTFSVGDNLDDCGLGGGGS